MEPELKSLRIDRTRKQSGEPSKWATRWIVIGVLLFVLLGAGRFIYAKLNAATEVSVMRVSAPSVSTSSSGGGDTVILNATGYIIAAHKIEVASKVLGRVAWIGVEKGDRVKQGQTLVRLEDDEYRAQFQQAKGNLIALQARLAELENGSRPEEVSRANADVEQAKADLANSEVTLKRTKQLVAEGVMAKQALDDAQAKYDSFNARLASLQRTYDLTKIGPRKEQIDAVKGQIEQAKGQLAYAQTQLDNTLIKAPVTGTILERAVEKGEFVTTSFVGDRGAKGYVVSLADLNDLKVELDINQNDFAKLGPQQRGVITTDAFPDRKYEGIIDEISPEANRQKATVQVKVKILHPDDYLRPEMNASVAFIGQDKNGGGSQTSSNPVVFVPTDAVRGGLVYIVVNGKALKRNVRVGGSTPQGLRIESGLIGGEDVILNPPPDLKEGERVRPKA